MEYSSKNTGGRTLTKSQVVAEIARLTAVFGPVKDRPAAILELMVDEWHNALKGFSFDVLHQAITDLVSEKRYWPVLSEVRGACSGIIAAEEYRLKAEEAAQAARSYQPPTAYKAPEPSPYAEFCRRVMGFIKRDEKTFCDFRDAGVRALHGLENVLAFDTEQDAQLIDERYGAALELYMGVRITLRVAPPAPHGWVDPKWEHTKVFTRH